MLRFLNNPNDKELETEFMEKVVKWLATEVLNDKVVLDRLARDKDVGSEEPINAAKKIIRRLEMPAEITQEVYDKLGKLAGKYLCAAAKKQDEISTIESAGHHNPEKIDELNQEMEQFNTIAVVVGSINNVFGENHEMGRFALVNDHPSDKNELVLA